MAPNPQIVAYVGKKRIQDPVLDALPRDADLLWVQRCLQRALKSDRPLRIWIQLPVTASTDEEGEGALPINQLATAFVNNMFQTEQAVPQDALKQAWRTFVGIGIGIGNDNDNDTAKTSKKFTKEAALRWIHGETGKSKHQIQRLVLSNLDPASLVEDYAVLGVTPITLHVAEEKRGTRAKPPPLSIWLDQARGRREPSAGKAVAAAAAVDLEKDGGASLGYLALRFPLTGHDGNPHYLSELFATVPLSSNLPFVSLYTTRDTEDAATPVGTHRILRSAQVPMPQVRLWTRPLISPSTSARTPMTVLRLAVLLRAPMPGEAPWYAQIMLKQAMNLNSQLYGTLRISLVNQNASIDDIHGLRWIDSVIAALKKAIGPIRDRTLSACIPWTICLLKTFAQNRLAVDVALTTITPQATVQGSATITLPLPPTTKSSSSKSTLATMAARASTSGPLGAWFTIVAQSPKALVLMYRSASGSSDPHRISRFIRLLWTRPRVDVIRELQLTFAINEASATLFYDQYAERPNASHLPISQWLRGYDVCPILILDLQGRTELRVSIHNLSRHAYLPRILHLVNLLVSTASSLPKPLPLPLPSSSSSSSHSKPKPKPKGSASDADADADADDNGISKELADLVSREFAAEDDDAVGDANAALEEDELSENATRTETGNLDGDVDGEEDKEDEDAFDESIVPSMYVLKRLHKADLALFKFPGTRYATICGKNNMRQPIALHVDDLARIDREYPGAHSGALTNHGSSPALASRNAYICPKVWCPRSRTALSMEQFKKLGNKCPGGGSDDRPIIYDNGYFKGRERYIGLIDAQHHPRSLRMPCCFLKPTRLGLPQQPKQPQQPQQNQKQQNQKQNQEPSDIKYVRGDVAPLEPSRYGILPPEIARVLHANVRVSCGPRDDGSGQLTSRAKCFVHRGIPQHPRGQALLACLAEVLDVKEAPNADALILLIISRLSATDFLQLGGGRLARRYMSNIDPINDVFRHPDATADLYHWLSGGSNGYVERFGLAHLASEAKQFAASKASSGNQNQKQQKQQQQKQPSLELQREALVRAGMRRYLEHLQDPSVVKTPKDGLVELASWPLPWLNPHRCNILLLERASSSSSSSSSSNLQQQQQQQQQQPDVFATCPDTPPTNAWRHEDPIIILLRQGTYYEPVVQVKVVQHRIQETIRFIPDTHPRIARAIRTFLGSCDATATPSSSSSSLLSTKLLSAMDLEGDPATAQVVNYALQLAGFLSSRKVYVPISGREGTLPLLLGNVGMTLDIRYQSDLPELCAATAPEAAKQLLAAIASRVGDYSIHPQAWIVGSPSQGKDAPPVKDVPVIGSSPPKNTVAIRSSGGTVIPLRNFSRIVHNDSIRWLSAIATLVSSAPVEHPLVLEEMSRIRQRNAARRDILKKLRESDESSQDLKILRSSLYPLTVSQRRTLAVRHFAHLVKQHPALPLTQTIDWLLFSPLTAPQALSASANAAAATATAAAAAATATFTDMDVAAGLLGDLLAENEPLAVAKDANSIIESELPMDRPRIRSRIRLKSKTRTIAHASTSPLSVTAVYSTGSSVLQAVDVYATIHLAHRILHSDAAFPLSAGVSAVQNAYINIRQQAKDIEPQSTLGKLIEKGNGRGKGGNGGDTTQAVLNAIANRGQTYAPSMFEIAALAEFFGVDVSIRSGVNAVPVPVPVRKTKTEQKQRQQQQRHFVLLQWPGPPEPVALVWARTPPSHEFTLLHEISLA